MALPVPNLDDLRFQRDLVDEARLRIIRYCPEWTEYNVSDPGITLIELFSWMTEMIVYRLNKVPDLNYIKFLEMIGVDLQPASSARADLTFRLSAPFPLRPGDETVAIVPAGLEVATNASPDAPEILFTTVEPLFIHGPELNQLRGEEFHKNYLPRLGIEIFHPFNERAPQIGDTFYLGFSETKDISGHILRLAFECEPTEAVGIRREDPPLVWECSTGEGLWEEILPSVQEGEKDTTGGLNNEVGDITFYLPMGFRPAPVYGRDAYWIRCRFEQRRPEQGFYSQSPRITNVQAYALGATIEAINAVFVYFEELGTSNGDPGQMFELAHRPVLDLAEDEVVEVEEIRDGEPVFIPWQRVADFAQSSRFDRHFVLDTATGQVHFGPGVRQPDGASKQYGRIPELGRRVHVTQYRHGGGAVGNVPARQIQVMRAAAPYIDRVTNLRRATGGRDQETLDEAKERARRELRAQNRAVTVEDFENLALAAGRDIARAKCLVPSAGQSSLPQGMLELLVIPSAFDSVELGDLSKLALSEELSVRVQRHLDQYRLLTTTLLVREPKYLGVKVHAEVVANEYSQPEVVVGRVVEVLRQYLSPLALPSGSTLPPGIVDDDWQGWPFGRSLFAAEIFSLVQQVPGVKHVLDIKLSHRPIIPGKEVASLGQLEEFADNLLSDTAGGGLRYQTDASTMTEVTEKALMVTADTVLCSLDHEIELVEL